MIGARPGRQPFERLLPGLTGILLAVLIAGLNERVAKVAMTFAPNYGSLLLLRVLQSLLGGAKPPMMMSVTQSQKAQPTISLSAVRLYNALGGGWDTD